MATVILRLPVVKMRTGLSRSSIYLWIARGEFPAPVSLGARAVGWVESEVDDWVAHRIEESRKKLSRKREHRPDQLVTRQQRTGSQ